jgi:uncharacterized protein (TIGR00369 family)
MSEEKIREVLESVAPLLVDGSPHAVALGLKIDQLEPDCIIMRAPYSPDLVGDPETGILHGGVVTALLDHACGLAAFAGLGAQDTPATLDLRIDYMRPAKPGLDVIAEASTVRAHGLVVFVRATAHDGDRDDPVAIAQAAFMVTKASQAATERAKKAFGQGETK